MATKKAPAITRIITWEVSKKITGTEEELAEKTLLTTSFLRAKFDKVEVQDDGSDDEEEAHPDKDEDEDDDDSEPELDFDR